MAMKQFQKCPILGIIRGIEEAIVQLLAETIVQSKLQTVEITLNTPKAPKLIDRMRRVSAGNLEVGAGTVLSIEDVKMSVDHGATFIVSPVFIPQMVEYCVKNSIPVFPGAITPQEIFTAWRAGATMVKVFPVKFYGPEYIQEIKGPFNDIELLACGGVFPENIKEYFAKGASAVAFGESIFKKEWMTPEGMRYVLESLNALVDAAGF